MQENRRHPYFYLVTFSYSQRGLNSKRGPRSFHPLLLSAPILNTLLRQKPLKQESFADEASNVSRAASMVHQHMKWPFIQLCNAFSNAGILLFILHNSMFVAVCQEVHQHMKWLFIQLCNAFSNAGILLIILYSLQLNVCGSLLLFSHLCIQTNIATRRQLEGIYRKRLG